MSAMTSVLRSSILDRYEAGKATYEELEQAVRIAAAEPDVREHE